MAGENNRVKTVLQNLENIQEAVKTGDYQRLGDLSKEQNAQIAALLNAHPPGSKIATAEVENLARQAEHTQRLLKASLSGLRSASHRKMEIMQTEQGLRTYNESGQPAVYSPVFRSMERRS